MSTTDLSTPTIETLAELGISYGFDEDGQVWFGDESGGRYTDPAPSIPAVERAAEAVADETAFRDAAHRFEVFHDALARYAGATTMTTPDLTNLPRADRMEIYEDNAGGIHLHPVGQGIVITVPSDGDALADCRLYGEEWTAADEPEAVTAVEDAMLDRMTHVATYRPDRDAIDIRDEPIGTAAREYLARYAGADS